MCALSGPPSTCLARWDLLSFRQADLGYLLLGSRLWTGITNSIHPYRGGSSRLSIPWGCFHMRAHSVPIMYSARVWGPAVMKSCSGRVLCGLSATAHQWAVCSPHLLLSDSSKPAPYFTLSLSDSSKPAPFFTVLSVKCKLVQDSVKKFLYTSGFSQKNLAFSAICFINFACGAIFSSKILRQFVSDSHFPCRK